MRTLLALLVFGGLAWPGLGGELGASLTWDGGATGYAWASLSGDFWGISLAGRGELDLFLLRPRLLSLSSKLRWEGITLSGGGKLLGTGRLDLSGGLELAGSWELEGAELSAGAALRATWAAVLAGGTPSTSLSARARVTAGLGWAETRLEVPWGGTPRTRLALGIGDGARLTLRLSLAGLSPSQVGLELGAGAGDVSGTAYFGLAPAYSATGSARFDFGPWDLALRLSLAPGRWGLSATAGTQLGELRIKAGLSFDREGFEKATLEFRHPLGI